MAKVTKNFDTTEFACKCGKCSNNIHIDLIYKLQNVRDLVGFPLPINSGYRCEEHNKKVGGDENSTHVLGLAADIRWEHMTAEQKQNLLNRALMLFKGIGLHEKFLHVDLRSRHALWFYPR